MNKLKVSDEGLVVLKRALHDYIVEVLDDPAWMQEEFPAFARDLRAACWSLRMDLDAVLDCHYNKYEVERFRKMERGEPL